MRMSTAISNMNKTFVVAKSHFFQTWMLKTHRLCGVTFMVSSQRLMPTMTGTNISPLARKN